VNAVDILSAAFFVRLEAGLRVGGVFVFVGLERVSGNGGR